MNEFIFKHRRGSSERWSNSDIVLYDGEIAIEDCGGGRRGILIGNGKDKYADLPKIYLHEVMTKTATIDLPADGWVGDVSPFYQPVTINGITEYSKIDLQPTPEVLMILQDDEVTLTTSNTDGVVQVWALGNKPSKDLQIQATITEVKVGS